MICFSFSVDAIHHNAITLPAEASGYRTLKIIPPLGHAYTLYDRNNVVAVPHSTDFERELPHLTGTAAWGGGETVAYMTLDSGSGTGYGILC